MPRDDAETRKKRRKAIRERHEAGMSNRAIGRALRLGETTVRFYVRQIERDKTSAEPRQKTDAITSAANIPENVIQLRREAQ
jgi:DNA-binding NarL/FixJ family response regulator